MWLAVPRAPSADEEAAGLAILDEEERRRWRRFLVPAPRLQYLAAHALLRRTLSRYRDVRPEAWTFKANAYGRPHIDAPTGSGLHFNLSHTDGLVAVVVAGERDIGVDVESMTRDSDIEALVPTVFAEPEARAFASAPASEKREVFFALWTLKEAYIKARGVGLSLGLDGQAFDIAGPEPVICFNERCPDDPARWRFWRFKPTPNHALAIAAPAHVRDVRIHWSEATEA